MNEAEANALARASEQYGIVTREAARKYGMTEREIDGRLDVGRWDSIHPNVYRINGAPISGRQRAFAACTWLGPESCVSYTTAAAILRIDGTRAPELHVTVPHSVRRGQLARDIHIHHSQQLARSDRIVVDLIPCTSGTRTVIDLAAMLDDEALEYSFERLRRMRLTSPQALASRASSLCGRGRPGSARVGRLLSVVGEHGLESRLEVKAARLMRAHGIIAPVRQFPVGKFRLDFAWPLLLVAVECDGFEWHGYRLAWKRDRRRIAALEARGWRIVHLTWDDVVHEPAQSLSRIAGALSRAA